MADVGRRIYAKKKLAQTITMTNQKQAKRGGEIVKSSFV